MQMGLIGLGKMGGNMRERLRAAGIEVIGYDINPKVSDVKSPVTWSSTVATVASPRTSTTRSCSRRRALAISTAA